MKKTKKTNIHLKKLIQDLKKKKTPIWVRIARDLEKPTRIRRAINLTKLNRYTKDNEQVIVPGKVLATGNLNHKLIIAAYQFSDTAYKKLKTTGSEVMQIRDLMEKNPKGSKIRIIG